MTTGPDTFSSYLRSGEAQPSVGGADNELTNLLSRLNTNRQSGQEGVVNNAAFQPVDSANQFPAQEAAAAVQNGGLTIVVNHAGDAPETASSGDSKPPVDTENWRGGNSYRHPRSTAGLVKGVAGLVVAGVVVYYGGEIIHGIERVWDNFTHAFQAQTNVKQEATAALSHIRIPNSTIAVEGDGSATATMSLGVKCPPVSLGLCNVLIPGTHHSVVPYIDARDDMTAQDQVILDESAWNFSAEVDANGVPHTVVAIDADHVSAQLANEENTPQTNNHLTENVADLLNLKTGSDQVAKITQDTARDVLQQACAKPLYEALPAGIARTVHFWEQQTADSLLGGTDQASVTRLHQMAGSTVIIKFIGSEVNLNGQQVVTDGVVDDTGLHVETSVTKDCKLSDQAQADLKAAQSQNGKTYVIEQTVPLSTKPNTADETTAPASESSQGN